MTPEDPHGPFMNRALDLAREALAAGEFPVGCVIASGDQVLAEGSRRGSGGASPNEVEHAEMVALGRLARRRAGSPESASPPLRIYCTLEPCLMCYGALLLSGVSELVFAYEDVMGGATGLDLEGLPALYRMARMAIVPGVRREESLALFRAFFSDPKNAYWQGSPLARYTLAGGAGPPAPGHSPPETA